jgi:group II intron reverse transcriptase/maturase
MGITETLSKTDTILNRIFWLSEQDKNKSFGSLMHLYNQESLEQCFHELDGSKAVGIDGMDKEEYGKNLRGNIEDLIERMKRMAYHPGPVKQVLIPKEGKPGATRPLGISNLEDKIIQKMTQKILNAIYEPAFLNCSHGFRPNRGCHTAIKDLMGYLYNNEIQTVIDIDLKNFFGTIDHQILEELLKERIKDFTFMRYITRMFKAGVLAEGDISISEEGVPQGSIASPVLSNIFAHYAIDLWMEEMVKPNCGGKVALIRYADDAVICCEYEEDALRIRGSLGKRLEKFKLQLNEEKTKLVSFDKRKAAQGIKQETFDFLGFTFYWGRSRGMRIIPKLKTRGKTVKAKLKKVKEWVKKERHKDSQVNLWKRFCKKIGGHIAYYGISHNSSSVQKFIWQSSKIFFKWINRRSQRASCNWEKFNEFLKTHPMPKAKIVHPLF